VARSVKSPAARGPLSDRLLGSLAGPLAPVPDLPAMATRMVSGCRALTDEDIQLSLLVLQELAYEGIDAADERWERSPDLLATRVVLEDACEAELRAAVEGPVSQVAQLAHVDVAAAIFELADAVEAPLLSAYMHRQATLEQLREFLVHRSIYHLKEADPHTWLVPRLRGAPKAALLEVQIDEYGGGRLDRMHAQLFTRTMLAAGLDSTYGAYVDRVPAATLAMTTTMTLFGQQRRLRGMTAGHLAAFEATSSLPNRRYAEGVRRLGLGEQGAAYFEEHVVADAVHEQVAARNLCGGLVASEPSLLGDVLIGAAACLILDGWAATAILGAWARHESALLPAQTPQVQVA